MAARRRGRAPALRPLRRRSPAHDARRVASTPRRRASLARVGGLRRRPAPRHRGLPRAAARAAAVPRGRGGRRQDRDRQGARRGARRDRWSGCSATRASTSPSRRVRVELPAPDDRDPARRGRRATSIRDDARARHLHASASCSKRPLLQALDAAPTASPPVLLIDELDRADEPFEAYLLEVLVRLPGDDPRARHRSARVQPPVVVITSNRTREIHDAIKRRCLYHWVDYPDAERELEILRAQGAGRARALVARGRRLRAAAARRWTSSRRPGVAETLDWARGADRARPHRARPGDGRRHARRAAQVPGRHRARARRGGRARSWRRSARRRAVDRPRVGPARRGVRRPAARLAENVLHFARVLRGAGFPSARRR